MSDRLQELVTDSTRVATAAPRPLGAVLLCAGIVHVLMPRVLLAVVATGYAHVLGVNFEPDSTTRRRVRAVGIGMLLLGGHLVYHGGLRPTSR